MRKDTDKEGNFYIHASSLNTFADCEMRWAAQNVNQITKVCEDETQKATGQGNGRLIGALFGTAAHLGLQLMLEEKQHTGSDFDFQRAYKLAADRLEEDCERAGNELIWDQVTKKDDVAKDQLKKVLKEAAIRYVPTVEPVMIEQDFECEWAPGFKLRGKMDGVFKAGNGEFACGIDDWKFGSKCGNYRGQIGAYKILLNSNYDVDIEGGRIIWIRRTGITIEQKRLIRISYDFDACINMATQATNRIVERVTDYRKEKNLAAFGRNPDSKFCTKKTCLAFGTSQCDAWIKETSDEQEEEAVLWAS